MRTLMLTWFALCATVLHAQIDRGGTVSGHVTMVKPAARFIVGQPFAGRTNGATLGFLPLPISTASSVLDEPTAGSLAVAPVPAQDVITVTVAPSGTDRTFTLYDVEGRQGAQGKIDANAMSVTVNVAQLPVGTYTLVLRTTTRVERLPVVIVR